MISALAVIDSRNVRGQAERVLGVACNPTVAGVREALAAYGFDAQDVRAGVALPSRNDLRRAGANRFQRVNQTNLALIEDVKRDGGAVLLGVLQWQNAEGTFTEKRVDVACAVAIAGEAARIADGKSAVEAILVVTDDTDLLPAIEYAIAASVPCFQVGTNPKLCHRGVPWIYLTDAMLATMCRPAVVAGRRRRAAVVAALASAGTPWEFVGPRPSGNRLVGQVRQPGGVSLRASFKPPGDQTTAPSQVYVTGAEVTSDREFPVLAVAGAAAPPRVESADVLEVISNFKARVRLRRGQGDPHRSVTVPLGQVVKDEEVVLHGRGTTFIGPRTAEAAATEGLGRPMVLTVAETLSARSFRAEADDGESWVLRHESAARIGERYAALAVDGPRGLRTLALARAISSRLSAEK